MKRPLFDHPRLRPIYVLKPHPDPCTETFTSCVSLFCPLRPTSLQAIAAQVGSKGTDDELCHDEKVRSIQATSCAVHRLGRMQRADSRLLAAARTASCQCSSA